MDEQSSNDIKAIISDMIDRHASNLHTAIEGTIKSFDPETNRAQVQPFGNFKVTDGSEFPYPIIYNVPVVFPTTNGGQSGLTLPVKSGDGCLIVFSEHNLDDYLSDIDSDDLRHHDMNDAICIPGLYSKAQTMNRSNPNDVVLYNGNMRLVMTQGDITISGGPVTVTDGNVDVPGNDVTASGISLNSHTHGGVRSGPSNTSGPQ